MTQTWRGQSRQIARLTSTGAPENIFCVVPSVDHVLEDSLEKLGNVTPVGRWSTSVSVERTASEGFADVGVVVIVTHFEFQCDFYKNECRSQIIFLKFIRFRDSDYWQYLEFNSEDGILGDCSEEFKVFIFGFQAINV